MVEGVRREGDHGFGGSIGVSQEITRRNAHKAIPHSVQKRVARFVARGSITSIMGLAIDFDNQLR